MRFARALVLMLAWVAAAAPVAGAQAPVDVSLSRQEVSTRLGESFAFTSRIENRGTTNLDGLIAHLNVVGLSSGIYVDPEDWSEERTKNVPALGPGESTELDWDVTAVTGGEAAIYVVALRGEEPGREELSVSPAMDVRIAESKDLNTDGVLPLTLAVPAVIAVAAFGARRRRRRPPGVR
jgi:uncharacterized membrane protein